MTSVFRTRLARSFRAFRRAKEGNVAIMFAIAIVPIIGLVGAAVDYSRANSARSALQAALDATALMISREAAGLSEEEIRQRAQAYFESLYNHSDASISPLDVHYTPNSGNGASVSISTRGSIQTAFMKVAGFPTIGFGSSTSTKWGAARLRVAMALDITGSMEQGRSNPTKLQAMKDAAKDLVDTLKSSATTTDDVYISIVPFNVMVNVGKDNVGADWIDWTEWEAPPAILGNNPDSLKQVGPGSDCPFTSSSHGFTCTDRPATASNAKKTNTIPDSGSYKGLICPSVDGGDKTPARSGIYYNGCYDSVEAGTTNMDKTVTGSSASCTGMTNCTCNGKSGSRKSCTGKVSVKTYTHNWVVNDKSTWTGCVADRNQDYDITADEPSTSGTKYPAMQYTDCKANSSLLPMTSAYNANESDNSQNTTTLKGKINKLAAAGYTNQSIGMHWAWMSLQQSAPLNAPALESNYQYTNVVILLSDGLNTQNRWYRSKNTNNSNDPAALEIDKRQKDLCDNAKAAGVEIFSILVNTDDSETSDVLEYCASNSKSNHYFSTTTAAGIGSAFNQIATQLSMLRLTQ